MKYHNFKNLVYILIACLYCFSNNLVLAQGPRKAPSMSVELRKQLKEKNKTRFFKAYPANFRLPGEFEPSKAVFISWAFDFDTSGNVIGLDYTEPYGTISAQLCNAIQVECQVWIRVLKARDTTAVINFMKNRNTPLYNYRFFIANGDDWWTRDFGPMAFYYDSDNKLGFSDLKYYDGRESDDVFNRQLARETGVENFETSLYAEGGNLMTDGFGMLFYSSVIDDVNSDNSIQNPAWTQTQINDTLTRVLGCSTLVDLNQLLCDGGTGHIDMYLKLLDEQTIIAMYYPNAVTAADKAIIENNLQKLTGLISTYTRPFRILRFEMPTDDDGNYSSRTCNQIDQDARTFINGTLVNKSMIYPSFYDGVSGNAEQHSRILQRYKDLLPGYKVVPIDSRDITPLGGAIHCITMQIPDNDPITIWHPSIDGLQSIKTNYPIIARIYSSQTSDSVQCFWRKNNESWNSFLLKDSLGSFYGAIEPNNILSSDSITYYLRVHSKSGKVATKPYTAPTHYYKLYFQAQSSGIYETAKDFLFLGYPNPANDNILFKWQWVSHPLFPRIRIIDMTGKIMLDSDCIYQNGNLGQQSIDLSAWPEGVYNCQLYSENGIASSRLFSIQRQ